MAREQLDVVVFAVGGQFYALPAADVRELVRAVAIVPLPQAPAIVEGIVNLRGKVVPVLDIRSRFRLPPKPVEPSDHFLVASAGEFLVAVRADRAVGLVRIDQADVEEASGLVPGVEYVAWIARLPNPVELADIDRGLAEHGLGLVLIHDLRTFLTRAESAELEGPSGPSRTRFLDERVRVRDRGRLVVTWTHPACESIAETLTRQTGLSCAARQASAEQGIRRAMRRMGVADLAVYQQLLEQGGPALDDLVVELTVGETYFFRETAQFAFLRREVLPALLATRSRDVPGPTVRAWSAGCASGEEAYTLAILLQEEGLGERAYVLATDISQAALAKARQAVYTNWSLRGEGAAQARPYLRSRGANWVLADEVRRRVTFAHLNLALDVYPSFAAGAWGMDLILCRNVLIYFDPETVRAVASRLFATLTPGGWLFTASSDPSLGPLAPFECVVADEGVFYRRPPGVGPYAPKRFSMATPVALLSPPLPPRVQEEPPRLATLQRSVDPPAKRYCEASLTPAPPPTDPLVEARSAFVKGDYGQVLERTSSLTSDPIASALRLRALANLDLAGAERESAEAVRRHPLSPELHYLQGTLLLGLGKVAEAARAVRNALYLDRSLAVVHCTLGAILEQCGDAAGARRAYRNARTLCAARPAEEEIPLADGERAGRLAETAGARLALLGDETGEAPA